MLTELLNERQRRKLPEGEGALLLLETFLEFNSINPVREIKTFYVTVM